MFPQIALLHYFSWVSNIHVCVCECVCVCVCVYTTSSLSCLSVDGHLHCFHILAIVNSAAVNIGMHVSFQTRGFVFSRYVFRSGISGLYGSSVCSCLRNIHIVLHIECINLLFHQQCTRVPSSLHTLQHLFFIGFLMMAILSSVRWYFIGVLIYICLITKNVEHLFMCLLSICVFFGEMSIQVFWPFFDWIVFFFSFSFN